MAFRMSEEEKALLEKRIELAGGLKQDYLIRAVLGQRVTVMGDEALFARMRDLLKGVYDELRRLDDPSLVRDEDVVNLRVAVEMIESVRPPSASVPDDGPVGTGVGAKARVGVSKARRCPVG